MTIFETFVFKYDIYFTSTKELKNYFLLNICINIIFDIYNMLKYKFNSQPFTIDKFTWQKDLIHITVKMYVNCRIELGPNSQLFTYYAENYSAFSSEHVDTVMEIGSLLIFNYNMTTQSVSL